MTKSTISVAELILKELSSKLEIHKYDFIKNHRSINDYGKGGTVPEREEFLAWGVKQKVFSSRWFQELNAAKMLKSPGAEEIEYAIPPNYDYLLKTLPNRNLLSEVDLPSFFRVVEEAISVGDLRIQELLNYPPSKGKDHQGPLNQKTEK